MVAYPLGRMESSMGRTRSAYPPEFREQMVALVRTGDERGDRVLAVRRRPGLQLPELRHRATTSKRSSATRCLWGARWYGRQVRHHDH